jgi:uncharacterized membrane protein YgcG
MKSVPLTACARREVAGSGGGLPAEHSLPRPATQRRPEPFLPRAGAVLCPALQRGLPRGPRVASRASAAFQRAQIVCCSRRVHALRRHRTVSRIMASDGELRTPRGHSKPDVEPGERSPPAADAATGQGKLLRAVTSAPEDERGQAAGTRPGQPTTITITVHGQATFADAGPVALLAGSLHTPHALASASQGGVLGAPAAQQDWPLRTVADGSLTAAHHAVFLYVRHAAGNLELAGQSAQGALNMRSFPSFQSVAVPVPAVVLAAARFDSPANRDGAPGPSTPVPAREALSSAQLLAAAAAPALTLASTDGGGEGRGDGGGEGGGGGGEGGGADFRHSRLLPIFLQSVAASAAMPNPSPPLHPASATSASSQHSSRNRVQCPTCGKQLSFRTSLSAHMRTHTRQRPFRCDWPGCSAAFAQRSNYRRHIASHRGDRPFFCAQCGVHFARKWGLQRHQRAAHAPATHPA